MQQNSRFYFIDNLRSIALLLGVIFHAAIAYGPYFKNIWFSADPNTNVFFNYLANWLHLFRMPLFFLIAGFCSALLIARKSEQTFIKLRFKRVLIPFFVFYPIIIAVFLHIFMWGTEIANPVPALFGVIQAIENPQISTIHLWFLWVLMQLCILHWCLTRLSDVYNYLSKVTINPLVLLLVLVLCSFISLLEQPVPFHAPDMLYPQFWAWGFYGAFYFAGAILYNNLQVIARGVKSTLVITGIAIVSLWYYFLLLPASPTLTQVIEAAQQGYFAPSGVQHSLLVAMQAIAIVSWTALALILGYNYLNKESKVSRYISESSYWVYLVHVPILLYMQLPLTNIDLPASIKFIFSVSGTLVISLVSYHYLIRGRFIGHLLNGKKPPSSRSPKSENNALAK
ncbi:acyltransferase family protein [Pseudoalteromonas sp. Of7M-16]|uniref:acyltransferase family protein n=1 Tax=Pseudoalteromonas sp. Of7M-16 TaxID=2917756 RepID=UPI001EF691F9|nr:acyltransferase family protein [Pseudoalteromonas sp. Of7M-16]MCG7546612.1 acyltransferase family protein [Pseudoalteromonas sp. Of7M-16]